MAQPRNKKPVASFGTREASSQRTRESILRSAISVFARYGYSGGSVEKISSLAKSHDRMIYYYFGSKEGLFIAVLEEIYRRMDEAEAQVAVDPSFPKEALKAVIRFKLNYYRAHPEFVAVLNSENLHKGKHISRAQKAADHPASTIGLITRIIDSGIAQGLFRKEVHPREVLLLIISTADVFTSHRYTLLTFLGEPMKSPEAAASWESFVVDSVLRVVSK